MSSDDKKNEGNRNDRGEASPDRGEASPDRGETSPDQVEASHDDGAILAAPLAWITKMVIQRPVAVLAVAVLACILAVGYAAVELDFKTNRLDLVDSDCDHNRLWVDYINEFGDKNDVVVVVEGAGRNEVIPVLDKLAKRLRGQGHLFQAVLHQVDLSKVRAKGLHYLSPDYLKSINGFAGQVEPIVRGGWARLSLGDMLENGCVRAERGDQRAAMELARMADSLSSVFCETGPPRWHWPEMPNDFATLSELTSDYFLFDDGKRGLVLLRLADDPAAGLVHNGKSIRTLRGLISQVAIEHEGVSVGLTGLPILEYDEMQSSQDSTTIATFLSLFGVSCLFVAGFGSFRHPLITVAALLLAIGWALGWATYGIGHLNILSMSFGVVLIGLGIDFGVHYAARYMQIAGKSVPTREALIRTSRGVGPGIVTGALTTAIAFFTAGMTDFLGIAELGIIAGGGVLLCCVAAIIVLPAMLCLSDGRRLRAQLPEPLDTYGCIKPLMRRPVLLLFATLAFTGTLAVGLQNSRFDHNLLNMQPEGLQSVQLEKKLLSENGQSVWFALSIADSPEELLRRKAQFAEMESVSQVREIASVLYPKNSKEKQPIIKSIHQRLSGLPERPPQIPLDSLERVGQLLGRAQIATAGVQNQKASNQFNQVRQVLRGMSRGEALGQVAEFQQGSAGDLLNRLHLLGSMSTPVPPKKSDLPEGLVARYVGVDGRHLLQIYPKGDIWDMDAMEQFVRDVRSVDEKATGNPLQTYEASRQLKSSYEMAAIQALIAIFLILYFDFRSVTHVILAMVPLGLGMTQLFGLLGLLDIPLNAANMIVLPLILGIGIDDGVHVMHDFRRQKGRYRMSSSTASAVLITSLTTMVGFGSLMIAEHRGLQSVGRVLTLGVSCCLFTSLIMLPAILTILTRNRPEAESDPDDVPRRRRDRDDRVDPSDRATGGGAPAPHFDPGKKETHDPKSPRPTMHPILERRSDAKGSWS